MKNTPLMRKTSFTNGWKQAKVAITDDTDRFVTSLIQPLENIMVSGGIFCNINPIVNDSNTCIIGNHNGSIFSFNFSKGGIKKKNT